MFRVGDLVQVRSHEEILATLAGDGRLDRLPFMPEMLAFCGRTFRVSRVAHKGCDSTTYAGGRRMHDAVFLEDIRCDGSGHGGCQAGCPFFWKTAWLRRAGDPAPGSAAAIRGGSSAHGCTSEQLSRSTEYVHSDGEIRYVCQATEHLAATEPLRSLAIGHFVEDVRTGNASIAEVLRTVGLHLVFKLRDIGFGWRVAVWAYGVVHKILTGRPDPWHDGSIPEGSPTPDVRLNLQPGEIVRVKSQDAILQTLNTRNRNRGLSFNVEATLFCGQQFRVARRVTRLIEERSGRMLTLKNPCIALEGVYCMAHYTHHALLCSRRLIHYFREAWLERVTEPVMPGSGPAASPNPALTGPAASDTPSG